MSENKTLREIALALLEKYRTEAEALICEKSSRITEDLMEIDCEYGWVRKQIEKAAESKDWMEQNKDRILQAGKEGREVEFRIDGRLFAIREKAQ